MASRVDSLGRAYQKSQLQVQLWVARRQPALTKAVIAALPSLGAELSPRLTWVSPLEGKRFAEYYDAPFVRAIERPDLVKPLAKFWPSGGPHWDGLAIARGARGEFLGPVLVEGKSYPAEMRSRVAAKDPESRRRIRAQLAEARAWLGVSEARAEAWSERYYQAANRIAHLWWFHDVLGERAWLANIYFLNDPDHATTRQQWDKALPKVDKALGLEDLQVPGEGRVFLEAGTRAELLAALAKSALGSAPVGSASGQTAAHF